MKHSHLICLKQLKGKGRGVFALEPIRRGAVIERAPVVLVPIAHVVGGLENRTLKTYFYIWTSRNVAISLGYGSLYNHSYHPNARYLRAFSRTAMTYRALRDIAAGEEITINYNFHPRSRAAVGFTVT